MQYRDLFNLQDKSAVVTGACGEIGCAIAMVLAVFGADIFAAGRNIEKTKKTVRTFKAAGRKGVPFRLEITSRVSAEKMAEAAIYYISYQTTY